MTLTDKLFRMAHFIAVVCNYRRLKTLQVSIDSIVSIIPIWNLHSKKKNTNSNLHSVPSSVQSNDLSPKNDKNV